MKLKKGKHKAALLGKRKIEQRPQVPAQKSRTNGPCTHGHECSHCGTKHSNSSICPAKGKQCSSSKNFNHFAKKCLSKKGNVHQIEVDTRLSDESEDDFFIDCIDSPVGDKQAFYTLLIGPEQTPVRFKLDTGSQANILPKSIFETLPSHTNNLTPSREKLSAYSGNTLNAIGCCKLACYHKGKSDMLLFHVVDTKSAPILGMRPCLDMGLIKLVYTCDLEETQTNKREVSAKSLSKESILTQYKDIFEGIDLLEGEVNIRTNPNIPPVVHAPRKIPLSLKEKLKQELARMKQQQIIAKVTEPTEWVSSLVVVQKPESGKLRICLDPRDLNRAILRPHYPSKKIEEILPELSGAKYFTKLDAKSGYWNLKLSNKSSLLTTFNTPFGRYRYLRLPFGLKSSQDEFQRKMNESYEGLEGVATLVDDILVFGKTKDEHDHRLIAVLDRSREKGIKLNKDKFEMGLTQVRYFGHLLTHEGLQPDPEKVRAVAQMKAPTNKSELETFLGMVTYLSKFTPNLSEITSPLRILLNQNTMFIWDQPQIEAFSKIKEILTHSPVLAYFDPDKPITLQVDASQHGLGAALAHARR